MTLFDHDYKDFPELTNTQLEVLHFSSPHVQILADFDAEVVKVTDGDTIMLRTSFRDFDFPLRLLDIDALEMNSGGEVAKEWLTNRLLGRNVRILINFSNRVGKFGRLLGRVFLDGLDVGQEELYLGLAKPFGTKEEGKIPNQHKVFDKRQWF